MVDKRKIWETLSESMRKAQEGDSREYERLLSQCREILSHYLSSKVRNESDREDLIQDILIGMHKAKATYRPNRPFAPWFFSIARYKTIDYIRRAGIRDRTVSLEIQDIPVPESNSKRPEDEWEIAQGLESWLSVLEPRQRQILTMAKLDGFSVREISQKTGLSESNVKVIVHRSLEKMKRFFSESERTGRESKLSKK
ncbi:RNA polymerase sigma factor [Leptospira wolffii]|uniref:RNA polymerase sigma factor n=1 Tax=Leptospira wolffii TaxID=409998 RepID=A0A2M9Z6U3_9LEPT|nr:RNA polymerase sigma factor [Leptospira wolffii]EPG66935.1 ECF sigma factor [Leptospira wolffii serovar Khorat str. Khorat-H2]PJZ64153.1 RNA polymerase sigma factor [Leptospira wolffii]TGK56857.1 RNA polymerase sigma factor [Leptospira wolffii]TGK71561.1 RNA polymerase sigma factor [Leptospira wolffii]TGK75582.1 RNA polymerase sigma factor [Leptospira wolffii]